MSRRPIAPLLIALVLGVFVASALPTSAAEAKVIKNGLTVSITSTNAAFSPNGDGSKDRGIIGYSLSKKAARVTIRITGGRTLVHSENPGRQTKGGYTLTWNGVRAGHVVSDGTYIVTITARRTRHSVAVVARTPLIVDARYPAQDGRIRLSSTMVYPRTTVIKDAVVGNFLPGLDFKATGALTTDRKHYAAVQRQVLNSLGRVVASSALGAVGDQPYDSPGVPTCRYGCGRFSWDGRTSDGKIAPAGVYRIRLVLGRDKAGNPRLLAPISYVRVSASKLTPRTESVSLAAARAQKVGYNGGDCATCNPELYCASQPSDRFPDGLSYRSTPLKFLADDCYVSDQFVLPFTGRRTTFDRFTVTAHGGPTTVGDDASGTLRAGAGEAVLMQGESTASAVDNSFTPNTEVPAAGVPSGLRWAFSVAPGDSYDLSSFDVTYTTYVPAS